MRGDEMKKNQKKIQSCRVKDLRAVQVIENRHFIRHPLTLPLAYTVVEPERNKEKKELKSETINISVGGLLFSAKHPVKPGMLISIRMPFEDKIFCIKATVVRCVDNLETKFYDIAVNFFRLREAFKVKMIEQIYLISEYRDLLNLKLGREVSLDDASREWIRKYSQRFKRLYW